MLLRSRSADLGSDHSYGYGSERWIRPATRCAGGDGAREIRRAWAAHEPVVSPTSGTTGRRRLVEHTRASVEASCRAVSEALAVDPRRDRWLACVPLRHVAGRAVVLRGEVTGTPVTVHERFDVAAVAAAAGACTLVSLVPTQLLRLLDAGAPVDRFRAVLLGGGPVRPGLSGPRDRRGRHCPHHLRAHRDVRWMRARRPCASPVCRCGSTPVRGEVLVRGPVLMRGYVDDDDATRARVHRRRLVPHRRRRPVRGRRPARDRRPVEGPRHHRRREREPDRRRAGARRASGARRRVRGGCARSGVGRARRRLRGRRRGRRRARDRRAARLRCATG